MSGLIICGVDPGSSESAYCLIDEDYRVLDAKKLLNVDFVSAIQFWTDRHKDNWKPNKQIAIENIQSYGAIVGKSTFETCKMIGRIQQVADDEGVCWFEYPRQEYANWICGCKADDARVRQALLTRFGGDKKGGPLEKLKGQGSDKRSAFAVAVYHLDKLKLAEAGR